MVPAPRCMPICAASPVRSGSTAKAPGNAAANPVFEANARIDPQYQEQLVPLLRLIAVERGEGRFDLKLN